MEYGCAAILKVKSMQRSGTEAIRTQLQQQEITILEIVKIQR